MTNPVHKWQQEIEGEGLEYSPLTPQSHVIITDYDHATRVRCATYKQWVHLWKGERKVET